MKKTLILTFSLKITYRVNGILYSLKQIPLVKKLLPGELYGMHWLKIVASVLSVGSGLGIFGEIPVSAPYGLSALSAV